MKQKNGPAKTRIIDGERFRRPTNRYYSATKAEHVAAGHRAYGRKARIVKATCPKGKKACVVYVRHRRS
jgi:hypothetical protein